MARKRKRSKGTHLVYRDYRPGHRGEFTSRETFNRSQGQGVTCHVHAERVSNRAVISRASDLFDYEDYDDDWPELEFHGTGDTGKSKGK